MRAAGEPEWNFSEKYVFGQSNQLVDRLSKVSFWCYNTFPSSRWGRRIIFFPLISRIQQLQNIIETDKKYSVLEHILMEDIQEFFVPIKKAYDEISNKDYDHLDFRYYSCYWAYYENWRNDICFSDKSSLRLILESGREL